MPLSGGGPQPYGFCEIQAGRYATRTGKSPGCGRYRVIVVGGDGTPFQTKIANVIQDQPYGKPLFPTHVFEVDLPARHGGVIDCDVPFDVLPSSLMSPGTETGKGSWIKNKWVGGTRRRILAPRN